MKISLGPDNRPLIYEEVYYNHSHGWYQLKIPYEFTHLIEGEHVGLYTIYTMEETYFEKYNYIGEIY